MVIGHHPECRYLVTNWHSTQGRCYWEQCHMHLAPSCSLPTSLPAAGRLGCMQASSREVAVGAGMAAADQPCGR